VANYLIRSCDLRTEYVVDDALEPGLTANTYSIVFTGESSQSCFNVISGTTDPITEGISSLTGYSDCLDCLRSINGAFLVVSCNYPLLSGPVNATQFTEWPIGQVYQICTDRNEFIDFTNENCLCFEVKELTPTPYIYNFGISGPFDDCSECSAPVSAGTEYTICNICETSTGVTVTTINPPHPTWTRPDGKPVVLLDAVQLGGMFGLNS